MIFIPAKMVVRIFVTYFHHLRSRFEQLIPLLPLRVQLELE
jgi:hypothetical protein